MGLGKRGEERLKKQAVPSSDVLYKQTEPTTPLPLVSEEKPRGRPKGEDVVPKRFQFSKVLNQRLRKFCFENECTEVDVVRKALEDYLKKYEN